MKPQTWKRDGFVERSSLEGTATYRLTARPLILEPVEERRHREGTPAGRRKPWQIALDNWFDRHPAVPLIVFAAFGALLMYLILTPA